MVLLVVGCYVWLAILKQALAEAEPPGLQAAAA
jgi:hypothetical protein